MPAMPIRTVTTTSSSKAAEVLKGHYRQHRPVTTAAGFLSRFSNGDATLGGVNDERLTRRSISARRSRGGELRRGSVEGRGREGGGPTAVESGAVTCVLTPELTAGPFYIPNEKLRRNITDGHPGTDADPPARRRRCLDLQADQGRRRRHLARRRRRQLLRLRGGSGSRTFMRGIQKTDARGIATLRTVYPGGTRAAPSTSTSRFTSAARSSITGSCSSPTR
jgi:hypothetical protein